MSNFFSKYALFATEIGSETGNPEAGHQIREAAIGWQPAELKKKGGHSAAPQTLPDEPFSRADRFRASFIQIIDKSCYIQNVYCAAAVSISSFPRNRGRAALIEVIYNEGRI